MIYDLKGIIRESLSYLHASIDCVLLSVLQHQCRGIGCNFSGGSVFSIQKELLSIGRSKSQKALGLDHHHNPKCSLVFFRNLLLNNNANSSFSLADFNLRVLLHYGVPSNPTSIGSGKTDIH
ncbi:unnamed protein product [Lupinus luteus]|uniref:Uncharacterized protein n=1 Tax=Lupinus luteus TaxID=3873 RepID=A0AAV1X9Q6_LUPLU